MAGLSILLKVFKSSALYGQLRRDELKGSILQAHHVSAYALDHLLLKRPNEPRTRKEERYNAAVCSATSRIERNFGILRRQFHILQGQCRYDPVKAGKITIACCILRNIAINAKEPANYDPPKDANPLYEEPVPDTDLHPRIRSGPKLV